MDEMFKKSSLYAYYEHVLVVEVAPRGMLERFDNWLYNVEGYDTADHPEVPLSYLFDLYRVKYAAYVLADAQQQFAIMMKRHGQKF